jgi:hypothetical protein
MRMCWSVILRHKSLFGLENLPSLLVFKTSMPEECCKPKGTLNTDHHPKCRCICPWIASNFSLLVSFRTFLHAFFFGCSQFLLCWSCYSSSVKVAKELIVASDVSWASTRTQVYPLMARTRCVEGTQCQME